MATIDGRVDVGDLKTLSISTTDAGGNELPDVEAEVEMTSPSGDSTTYDQSDMRESEGKLFLDVLFDEPGFWFARIEVQNAGGQETDRRVYRAVTREQPNLSLLTADVWHEYLSEDAMEEGPDRLQKLVGAAEEKVVGRYRETNTRTDNLLLEAHYDSDIRLDGWVEDDQGEPDLDRMDSGLLHALRRVIASLVDHEVQSPNQHILRIDQGERRVQYKPDAGELPTGLYLPLTDFDERKTFSF